VLLAEKVESVSPERLAAELRLMFSRHGRGEALRLLVGTNLIGPLFDHRLKEAESFWCSASDVLDAMREPNISLAIAVLCYEKPRLAADICNHLRLSNHERKLTVWLIEAIMGLESDSLSAQYTDIPWSVLQPWLAHEWRFYLFDLMQSLAAINLFSTEKVDWVSEQVHRTDADLNPPQLLCGNDLMQLGVPSGPVVGKLLKQLRDLQLDEKIISKEVAIQWVEQHCDSD
jgi:tRNA nucleotidyltransferase/poly(A) polymerase